MAGRIFRSAVETINAGGQAMAFRTARPDFQTGVYMRAGLGIVFRVKGLLGGAALSPGPPLNSAPRARHPERQGDQQSPEGMPSQPAACKAHGTRRRRHLFPAQLWVPLPCSKPW